MTSNERHQADLGEVRHSLSPSADLNDANNSSDWIEEAGADPQADYEAKQLNLAKKTDPLVGKVLFGTYQIIDLLGEGAMGVVYKARHLAFDRLVAMKTIKLDDPELLARFAREVKLHGALKHQNIVEAIDCLQAPNKKTFFVMEFVDGVSLELVIRDKSKSLSEEEIFEITNQVASALGYAHQQGVIHRDLKPGNMIVCEKDGKIIVKVMDFGIAKLQESVQKLTKTGQAVGSPIYMSPEQCMGQDLDGRADIYSLGVMLYELITGSVPFLGKNLLATMEMHCTPELHKIKPLSEYDLELKGQEMMQSIIERCLAIEPKDRFQNCQDLRKSLEFWYKSVSRADGSVRFPTELSLPNRKVSEPSPDRRNLGGQSTQIPDTKAAKADRKAPEKESKLNGLQSSSVFMSIAVGLLLAVAIIAVIFLFTRFTPPAAPNANPKAKPESTPSSLTPVQSQTATPILKTAPNVAPSLSGEKRQTEKTAAPPQSQSSTGGSKVSAGPIKDVSRRTKVESARRVITKPVAVKSVHRVKSDVPAKTKEGANSTDSNPFSRLRLQKD